MAASSKMFHRFDTFNDAYNPFGKTDLRTVFMKTSNAIGGRYFAEVIRDVVFARENQSNVMLEPRLSIYGFGIEEWRSLADFFVHHRVLDCDHTGATRETVMDDSDTSTLQCFHGEKIP